MNVRKPIDYSGMYTVLDQLMAEELPQVDLYFEIGRAVSTRAEKGAAVAASEYLQAVYPEVAGFSPRNLRRMREFYCTYADAPELAVQARRISWLQNVVILEAALTMKGRAWYLQAAKQFSWSKKELADQISASAHLKTALDDVEGIAILSGKKRFRSARNRMTRILFVCHGNICRSPMAEFLMKDLVKKTGLEQEFHIDSASTSREEIGNPVYPPARRKLAEHGIDCTGKTARQLQNSDYDQYDLLIGMDRGNLHDMYRICGGDFDGKMHLLMEYAGRPDQEVADPWYTDDFEATWRDVLAGCQGILKEIGNKNG